MRQLLQMPLAGQKLRVEELAQIGAAEEDIALELQIPLKRLQKRFRRELERGSAKGKSEVLQGLFEKAKSGSNMTATALWVKARCGWRDTGSGQNAPEVIHSVLKVITANHENRQSRT